jgi:integrase
MRWGDVDLETSTLVIPDGKARREDRVPIHPQLTESLRRERPRLATPAAKVFDSVVTDRTRQKDFERAGIPLQDEQGRVVDLHALRTTLGTRLAREGVTTAGRASDPPACCLAQPPASYRASSRRKRLAEHRDHGVEK